jgi:citrate lyase subunit beta/citryl-CoA lyase
MTAVHHCDASGTTWLFVPGNRPDRFDMAVASGADNVILDLEDAVAADAKSAAREHVQQWLNDGGRGWVRINATGTRWHDDDLTTLRSCRGLAGVVMPKAEDPELLNDLCAQLPQEMPVVALVETARGILSASALAECPVVARLAFGSVDYLLDIDAEHSDSALLLARSSLVLASRAAGKAAPLDGVTTALAEPSRTATDAAQARSLGFGGKLCIHPSQVEIVAAAFRPTEQLVRWASEVVLAVQSSPDRR